MKALNVNAGRTSHYPNNPYFYDLCDRYGIYVLAEANVAVSYTHLDVYKRQVKHLFHGF